MAADVEPAPASAPVVETRPVEVQEPTTRPSIASGIPPGASIPSDLSGLVPQTDWRDVGNATPAAALETYLWAVRNGQVERLAELIKVMIAPAEHDDFLAKLPPEARKQYEKPEAVAALSLASQEHRFAIFDSAKLNDNPRPDHVSFSIRLRDEDGNILWKVVPLHLTESGWRVGMLGRGRYDELLGRPRRGFPAFFEAKK